MKMQILFVDDQPNVLAGLGRMLHRLRDEWEMEFVTSGKEALALMAQRPFAVIVSDMRMPGMDGAELLTEVMKRYPSTVRIILSGQADQMSVLRAVNPAHQYLSKPCDANTLKRTISRACALRSTLRQDSLIRVVSQVTTLPSLPSVYTKVIEQLESDDSSICDIAELISQDVGMTTKLMQMVNSSFFGAPRRIESPSQAVAMLGLNLLRPLVLSAGIFSQFPSHLVKGYSINLLAEHSMAVSRLAEQITLAECEDKRLAEDAMLAGLIHDVGQLLLAANMPGEFSQALNMAQEQSIPLYEAELECLGAHHANVGAYLIGLWGMADAIVEAIAYHHQPSECQATSFTPLTAVHVANVLVNDISPTHEITLCQKPDMEYLQRLGLDEHLPKWREMADALFMTHNAASTP